MAIQNSWSWNFISVFSQVDTITWKETLNPVCGSSMNVTVVLLLFFSILAFLIYIQAFMSVLEYRLVTALYFLGRIGTGNN